MKKLFYLGWLGLLLFEVANVYFIMPMPGSQEMNSIDLAYFLYKWRWVFRILFGLMILVGLFKAKWKRKWTLAIPLLLLGAVIYMANFKMAADHMFYQPNKVLMLTAAENKVDTQSLVIGVVNNGEAKAYPIRFLGYHHQVQDTVGNKPMIITYCTVCRTGRVYEPIVNGKPEKFRLVGMDHFNAMFEDASTGSWWRQVSGEAITGKLKGQHLPEVYSTQTSLSDWLNLYPNSRIMQADPAYIASYDTSGRYERGKSKSNLTRTDSLSWGDKSWVVGVKSGQERKAYDWNELQKTRMIEDTIGTQPVVLVMSTNKKGFFALMKNSPADSVSLSGDTLIYNNLRYHLNGRAIDSAYALKVLPAYQEFWHSWRTFNPSTTRYPK